MWQGLTHLWPFLLYTGRRRALGATLVATAIAASTVIYTTTNGGGGSSPVTPDVYVGQSSAGSGDGLSCANQKAATFFNTAGNWGAGNPIAPGKVVGLCGTITSKLTAQGSGTAGNPVTIYFTSGSKISMATCDCFDLSGRDYVTINGGTNGVIEATDNGTALGHNVSGKAIDATSCGHCTVTSLIISNIYVKSCGGCDDTGGFDHTLSDAVYANGTDFTFSNNTVHDVGWGVYDNLGTNLTISGNSISHIDHGITLSGGGTGNVIIANNHIFDMANWDGAGNNCCHHDGIHCYTVNGGTPNHYGGGIYIYDNRFDGTIGTTGTSEIFIEGNTGPSATPCEDSTSPLYLFNNYVHPSDHNETNGIISPTTGQVFLYNNTIIGAANNSGYAWDCCAGNTGVGASENNAWGTIDHTFAATTYFMPTDYNVYGDIGGFVQPKYNCSSQTNTFATYQAEGCDVHGAAGASLGVNGSGVPQGGSILLNAGTNLTSLCSGKLVPLCSDIDGHARPAGGAWDAGAWEVSS